MQIEMKGHEDLQQQVAIFEKIEKEIALIQEVPDAKGKRDQVEALRVYAKQSGQVMALQNKFTEMRLRLERRTGELLIEQGIIPGNPQLYSRGIIENTQSLSDFGISANQSSKWQKIARIPAEVFENFLASMRDGTKEITTAAALKLFRTAAGQERRVKTMETIAESKTPAGDIIHGCMVEEILDMTPGFADLIVTDPPFCLGETADIEFSDRENMSRPAGDWDDPGSVNAFRAWCEMFRRAIKPDGSLYCFVSDRYMAEMYLALDVNDFVIQELLVWRKTNPPPSVRERAWRSNVEYIIYATAGEGYTRNWLGQERMLKCQELPICGGKERLDHPTQKPVNLLKQYIEVSSNEGDVVLDPFAGVGSTGAAAGQLDRHYVLIERDDYYHRQACIRLRGSV